jgi:hypothetical protein
MDKNTYTDIGVERITARCTALQEFSLGSIAMTDKSMTYIARLRGLKQLLLFGADAVTDASLPALTSLKSLEYLHLSPARTSIAGLRVLKDLPKLERLNVRDLTRGSTSLDLSGFAALRYLTLSFQRKSGDFFDDADLAGLADCKNLEWLQIGPRKFSDEGLAHLAGLAKMERLGIGGPDLTDHGLVHLLNMKDLNHLSIDDGRFTAEALRHLEQISAMSNLFLPTCPAFDHNAQRRLKSRLPNLYSIIVYPKPQSGRSDPRR